MTTRYMYHGTDTIITAVDLNKSRLRTDFGKGFYLSSKLGVARDWAVDKTGATKIPITMRFTIDAAKINTPGLLVLRFDQPTVEWLNFIRDNHRGKADSLKQYVWCHLMTLLFFLKFNLHGIILRHRLARLRGVWSLYDVKK